MALPKQVQQQADAVAEFERQQREAQSAPPNEPQAEPSPTPPAVAAVEPSAPAVPVAAVEPKHDDVWEQKYRTLEGMFRRETRVLREQLQAASEQLVAASEQLKALKKQPDAPAVPLVTDTDSEKFGSDLVDMARRVAREEFGTREAQYLDRIATLEQQVSQKVGEVQQTQQTSSREGFFHRLSQAIPTWETVQGSSECQQWLSQRVPGASFTWNDVLVDAAEKFDAGRAIEVFQTFIAMTTPPPTPLPAPAPAPAPRARAPELARQVTPPKSNATPPTPTAEKRVYTGAEYAAESQRQVRLTKAGQIDEANRIEAELNAALSEGRIRP